MKGHVNHMCKNVRSTEEKLAKFKTTDTENLRGKKERDVYIKVYNTHKTIYSNQTGQFPKQLLHNNKHIMAMVTIDSNFILVKPMTSRKDKKCKMPTKISWVD